MPKTHSIAQRKQRTVAGKLGGLATASRHTPQEIKTIHQLAATKRAENMALDECKTEAERAALLADPAELARRAEINKSRIMAPVRAAAKVALSTRRTKAEEQALMTALAVASIAQARTLRAENAQLRAELELLRAS